MGEVGEDVCELSPTVVHVELCPWSLVCRQRGDRRESFWSQGQGFKSGVPLTPMNTMSSLIPEFVSYL